MLYITLKNKRIGFLSTLPRLYQSYFLTSTAQSNVDDEHGTQLLHTRCASESLRHQYDGRLARARGTEQVNAVKEWRAANTNGKMAHLRKRRRRRRRIPLIRRPWMQPAVLMMPVCGTLAEPLSYVTTAETPPLQYSFC